MALLPAAAVFVGMVLGVGCGGDSLSPTPTPEVTAGPTATPTSQLSGELWDKLRAVTLDATDISSQALAVDEQDLLPADVAQFLPYDPEAASKLVDWGLEGAHVAKFRDGDRSIVLAVQAYGDAAGAESALEFSRASIPAAAGRVESTEEAEVTSVEVNEFPVPAIGESAYGVESRIGVKGREVEVETTFVTRTIAFRQGPFIVTINSYPALEEDDIIALAAKAQQRVAAALSDG